MQRICTHCNKSLKKINSDWSGRKMHKKCFKENEMLETQKFIKNEIEEIDKKNKVNIKKTYYL